MAWITILEHEWPEAASYRGPAERGVSVFKGAHYKSVAGVMLPRLLARLGPAVLNNGGIPLVLKVEVEDSGIITSEYRFSLAVGTPDAVAAESNLFLAQMSIPFLWAALLPVMLTTGLLLLAGWQVSRIDWGPIGFGGAIWGIAALAALYLWGKSQGRRHGKA